MIRLPMPAHSAAVVAALELLWPEEEEKKNEICEPVQAPHDLQDWFINSR